MFRKIIIVLIIFFGAITFAQSETSWIKKKDKSEKVEKEKKKNSSWIKKKKVKENKKKLKEKVKDSKSWITKKSKEKVQDIKEKLKKHKTIENLPKADVYFIAEIIPNDQNEKAEYFYGFIKNDKKSEKINFEGQQMYKNGEGFAYFENKKNRCSLDVEFVPTRSRLATDIIFDCGNKKMMESFSYLVTFKEKEVNFGEGGGTHWEGNDIKFEFYGNKEMSNTYLSLIKKEREKLIASNKSFDQDNSNNKENLNLKISGKYYALLIGNSNYDQVEWTNLTSPVNDVSEIGKILKSKYNFEDVLIVKNANRDKMFESIEKLSTMTTDKDYVLIYYAGHGDIKGNKSYWIPIDGQKKSISKWINLSDIENSILEIPAHHLAIMVDSCYFSVSKGNNLINQGPKSKLYQKFLNKRARVVLSSGNNEPVDDTGAGKHSIFGMSFINSLKNNDIISFREIGNDIAYAHAGMRQQPYLHLMLNWGHTNGDFVFVSKK